MRYFKLTLSYDGTEYAGFQWQENARTIQAELEQALETIVGQPVRVRASGRTDAGVHALGQVVGFGGPTQLPPETLVRALNANLPRDIIVLAVAEVPADFHAIRAARRKRYRYVIQDGRLPDVFCRRFAWQIPRNLDLAAMQQAAAVLVGRHDFSSFESSGSPRVSSIRTIYELLVERRPGDHLDRIFIEIEADGFLYNMVRNIVGTLVEIGLGRTLPTAMAEILAAKDRTAAGQTAPAHGLFLLWVETNP